MARAHTEVVSLKGTKGGETNKAVFFTLNAVEYPDLVVHGYWFPFSQVTQIHSDCIVVSRWILEQKDIYNDVMGLNKGEQ